MVTHYQLTPEQIDKAMQAQSGLRLAIGCAAAGIERLSSIRPDDTYASGLFRVAAHSFREAADECTRWEHLLKGRNKSEPEPTVSDAESMGQQKNGSILVDGVGVASTDLSTFKTVGDIDAWMYRAVWYACNEWDLQHYGPEARFDKLYSPAINRRVNQRRLELLHQEMGELQGG